MKSLTLILLSVTLMVQSALPAVQAQTVCDGTSATFIGLRSGYLCLNGSRIRFVGANIPSLLGAGYLPGSSNTPSGPTRLRDAGHYNISLVKVWLDNPCPSTAYQLLQSDPTAFFASVDSMLSDAKNNKIFLNPALVTTHNTACWNAWTSALGGDFITNSQVDSVLKNTWVKPIVSHYSSNGQVAYWELSGEPDCLGCGGSSDSLQQVISWVNDMASYIRSIDPNHLISADWGGFGQLPWTGSSWDWSIVDKKTQYMDFVSVHTYGSNNQPPGPSTPGGLSQIYNSGKTDGSLLGATNYYVNLYTTHAHSMGKAMEFSEYGQDISSSGDPAGAWNQMLLNATANKDSDSSEVWAWDSPGVGSIWNISPSTNPILVQAMSYWSTIISPGGTQLASDFTISASTPATALVGESRSSTVSVAALGGFAGTITLTDIVPSGLTCTSITPSSIAGSGVAVVSCSSSVDGAYPLTVTGTNGSLTRTATATFSFQDFVISASSPAETATGSSGASIITLTALNGFKGTVSLTVDVPSGLTCGSPSPGSMSNSGTATLSCNSSDQNIYIVTIIGASGSLNHNTTASFTFGSGAGPSGGGFCLSCIGSINWSNMDWLLIIGGLIGLISSMALLNAKATTKLHRARARLATSVGRRPTD